MGNFKWNNQIFSLTLRSSADDLRNRYRSAQGISLEWRNNFIATLIEIHSMRRASLATFFFGGETSKITYPNLSKIRLSRLA